MRGQGLSKKNAPRPPKRYSEATLIRAMEALGIGRPSTYTAMSHRLNQQNVPTAKSS